MISQEELMKAISECENAPDSYHNCQRLATFYNIYDHLYQEDDKPITAVSKEIVIGNYGKSKFLNMIQGRSPEEVWKIIDELMDTLSIIDDRLYTSVLRKIDTL